jgi:hypothetical protein
MPDWGYLTQYWNRLATTTITGGEYIISWFQNIGNAVAGAIGNLFDFIIHYFNDFLCFINYFAHNLGFIFNQLLSPVKYIFVFSSNFFNNVFSAPILPENLEGFSSTTITFINSLPYWSDIKIGIGVIFFIIASLGILKLFLKT